MAPDTVFVVSDDAAIRDSCSELLAAAGLPVEALRCSDSWLGGIPPARRGIVVLDAGSFGLDHPQRAAWFAAECARRPVLLLIDRGDVPMAVLAMKCGSAVVEKPCRGAALLEAIQAANAAWPGAAYAPVGGS